MAGTRKSRTLALCLVGVLVAGLAASVEASPGLPGEVHPRAERIRIVATSTVNFAEAAAKEARTPAPPPAGISVAPDTAPPPQPSTAGTAAPPLATRPLGPTRRTPSPAAALTFAGLDDITNVTTGFFSIPPDTNGAVGLDKVVEALNNNIRIRDKATGTTLSTLSANTFWASVGGSGFFDPRTTYDPYNDRWIMVELSDAGTAASSLDVAVSKTSDPEGEWWLFRIDADGTDTNWADFPLVGFNKNWVAIGLNYFANADNAWAYSKVLVFDYPSLRGGAATSSSFSTDFSTAPAATYSTSESTLYAVSQWGHSGTGTGLYRTWTITGTPSTPSVTGSACCYDRGVAWADPPSAGNIGPQAAPSSGASACGATPCMVNLNSSRLMTTPVFRNGYFYYVQEIGLPYPTMAHTAVLWTKLDASTSGVVDGGLIEDAAATDSNGGKWYAFPSIAVNASGTVLIGFSQLSSSQWPSAGYALRTSGDAAGTMRDPVIYKAGEDYYHKTFSGSRNRWGDYSSTQVDPSNDTDLWTLQEYAKARVGTDDGTTGSNSSRWGTYWAKVAPSGPDAMVKAAADAGYLGDGTYNLTGVGQARQLRIRRGGRATFSVQMQNDASVADTLTLNGSGSSAGFAVSYLDGSTTITSSVTGPGYSTALLAPGATSVITVKVKVARTASGRKTVTLTVGSGTDPAAKDVALAKVRVKRA